MGNSAAGMSKVEFKGVFDQYYEPLRNFVYYKTGDIDVAEDLVQEVMVKLWEKRASVKLETVKSYLYTMANNLMINRFKHQQVVYQFQAEAVHAMKDASAETPEFTLEMAEFDAHLQRVLASIPEPNRIVFLMNRLDKLTYREIAERLELSVKAVEKRMEKALSIVREQIKHSI
ncbi:MAG TPA: RNA polymerase subunit sigma-70 [Cytophagales bacterium]|nr:RNA polymerase subunit sigma-70 [Cytophagales bacterium]HAP65102.1 RNA polymerase subunit sigma-70 [Cytophagales bacterium]